MICCIFSCVCWGIEYYDALFRQIVCVCVYLCRPQQSFGFLLAILIHIIINYEVIKTNMRVVVFPSFSLFYSVSICSSVLFYFLFFISNACKRNMYVNHNKTDHSQFSFGATEWCLPNARAREMQASAQRLPKEYDISRSGERS